MPRFVIRAEVKSEFLERATGVMKAIVCRFDGGNFSLFFLMRIAGRCTGVVAFFEHGSVRV